MDQLTADKLVRETKKAVPIKGIVVSGDGGHYLLFRVLACSDLESGTESHFKYAPEIKITNGILESGYYTLH